MFKKKVSVIICEFILGCSRLEFVGFRDIGCVEVRFIF